jgi:hypothetical protein
LALKAAQEHLRAVLNGPWGSRRLPSARIQDALQQFGLRRQAALPVVMEVLKRGDPERRFTALAALEYLGTDAAAALPDLLDLLKADKLAVANDQIARTFLAIHPAADLIPDLVDALKGPASYSRSSVSGLILQLVQNNPGSEATYSPVVAELLSEDNPDVRLVAARTLAGFPGQKDPTVLSELMSGLNPAAVQDPHFFDPIVDEEHATTNLREGEVLQNEARQFTAVAGLTALGNSASNALPWLDMLAQSTSNDTLRQLAMIAIGTIDPQARAVMPEIDGVMRDREIGSALAQKAASGQATFDDLLEGLQHQGSVGQCAQALGALGADAMPALTALTAAFQSYGDYDAGEAIKRLAPETLVACLKPPAVSAAALALGDLGPQAAFALPALYQALETGPAGDRPSLAEAIQQIDPSAPKPLYGYNDLAPAVMALREAGKQAAPEIRDAIQQICDNQLKDLNRMTRGEVVASANAVLQTDGQMYQIFLTKLFAANPSLRQVLPSGR